MFGRLCSGSYSPNLVAVDCCEAGAAAPAALARAVAAARAPNAAAAALPRVPQPHLGEEEGEDAEKETYVSVAVCTRRQADTLTGRVKARRCVVASQPITKDQTQRAHAHVLTVLSLDADAMSASVGCQSTQLTRWW